jgi:predicted negative regulator of RcsB-dependent stress response
MLRNPFTDRPTPKRQSKTIDLQAEADKMLQAGKLQEALDLYCLIEIRKPTEPRWARRKGDLLLRMGRKDDAALAFERAARLYAARGFEARASAMAKLVQTLNPV